MRRSPARLRSRPKRQVRLVGSMGLPVTMVKTSSLSVQPVPVSWRSSCWRSRWLSREWTHSVGRAMRRSDARILVCRVVRPLVRLHWREGWMLAGPPSRVKVFPVQAEEFALAESGAQGEFVHRVQPVTADGLKELLGFGHRKRLETSRAGVRWTLRSGPRCAAVRPR